MTSIRTPEDEVDRPGFFYPPFTSGWFYQGATYAGHTDASVDWNRRTKNGGWLDDTGDPVLAAADGTVAEVDKSNGLVMLNHFGGLWRTEYRHMTDIKVKVGDKVQRGDRVGSIGNVAGDGRSFGAHLHHVHWKRPTTAAAWQRTRMRFYDKPVEVSVPDSDTKPASWKAPDPVMVEGPPPKATWESAYREAAKALGKAQDALAASKAQVELVTDERDQARRDLAACQAATPPDCTAALKTQRDSLIAAVRNGVGGLLDGLVEG